MHEIQLTGMDGGNFLGYLAALGALRVLTLAEPDEKVRLSWRDEGWWMPALHHSRIGAEEDLVSALSGKVCPPDGGSAPLENANPAFREDYLDESLLDYGERLRASALDPRGREAADFFAALGSDAFPETGKESPATTALRAIAGGNNAGFLGLMREIHTETHPEHLSKALFKAWDYSDPPPFMRWDPNEYRPHALRATDPARDRKQNNVRGANRLAIEALPLFATVPGQRRIHTAAFGRQDRQIIVTWPIWKEPLDLSVVASLLVLDEVQSADSATMARRCIAQVFRAERFTDGQYRNFSPARALI